jgi:AmmeMemoRadiSam system protein A
MAIESPDRQLLLTLALRSIAGGFGLAAALAPPPGSTLPAALLEPGASFVTLKRAGQLRGCRGLLEPIRPLAHDVWHNAWASAFDDPRFPPLAPGELAGLDVGISILSALERVVARSEAELLGSLEPGRHGLVLALGPRRATFLPQVWESLPDPDQFLAELKGKAGLPRDLWPAGMEAWRYTVESVGQVA